jgi:hypothetical protein
MLTTKESLIKTEVLNAYQNAKGKTECAYFVSRGTAIATFVNGRYPTDDLGKHAAIYLSHDKNGIEVLDQWNAQGMVKKRTIRAHKPEGTRRSNVAEFFYVIE